MSDKEDNYKPLQFEFTKDPNVPIPAITAYTVKKKYGQIPQDMSYEDFLKLYETNIISVDTM